MKEVKPAFPLFKDHGPVKLCPADLKSLIESGLFDAHLDELSKDASMMKEAPDSSALINFCLKTIDNMKIPSEISDKCSQRELIVLFMGLAILQGLQIGIVIGAANEAGSIYSLNEKEDIDLANAVPITTHVN